MDEADGDDDDDDDDEEEGDDDDAVAALDFFSFASCAPTAACASESARAADRHKPYRSESDGLAAASALASTYALPSVIADVMSLVMRLSSSDSLRVLLKSRRCVNASWVAVVSFSARLRALGVAPRVRLERRREL